MKTRVLSLLSISACLAASAVGQTPMTVQNTNQMKWGPAPNMLPKGAKLAVLSGNPMASGPFVMRIKMPAGYQVPAHWHSADEYITVISGDFHGGMGDKLDKSKSKSLKVGGFCVMPAKMHHFAWTSKGCVVQLNAMGPFDIHYLDPKTDPTKGH